MPFGLPSKPLTKLTEKIFGKDGGKNKDESNYPLVELANHILDKEGPESTNQPPLPVVEPPETLRRTSATMPSSPMDIGTANPAGTVDVGHALSETHASYTPQVGPTSSDPVLGRLEGAIAGTLKPREQELLDIIKEAHTAWSSDDFSTVMKDLKTIQAIADPNQETERLIANAYIDIAHQLQQKGNIDQAKQCIEEALKIEPDNAEYRKTYNELTGKA